jgi:hypothetical protein
MTYGAIIGEPHGGSVEAIACLTYQLKHLRFRWPLLARGVGGESVGGWEIIGLRCSASCACKMR